MDNVATGTPMETCCCVGWLKLREIYPESFDWTPSTQLLDCALHPHHSLHAYFLHLLTCSEPSI
eukprot:595345-Pelagomonas_calceolata.AAC.3